MDHIWDLWKDGDKTDKNKTPTPEPQDKNALHSLPGVFVPTCGSGTVVFPKTHRAPSGRKHPRHALPKQPATTVDCSLISDGAPGNASWKPAASPATRRPSKCQPADDNSPPSAVDAVVEAATKGELPPKDPDQSSAANPRLAADPRRTASAGFGTQDLARKGAGNTADKGGPEIQLYPVEVPASVQPDALGLHRPSPDPEGLLLDGAEQEEASAPTPGQVKRRRDILRRVVRKVRSHMVKQPLGDPEGGTTAPHPTAQCRRGSCEYTLTDRQVQDIVEIICRELCNHSKQVDAEQFPDGKHPKTLGTSGEVHTGVVRKPSCLSNAIEPQAPGAADPTPTTIESTPAIFSLGTLKIAHSGEEAAATQSLPTSEPNSDKSRDQAVDGQADHATGQVPRSSTQASAGESPTSSTVPSGGLMSSLKAMLGSTKPTKEESKEPEAPENANTDTRPARSDTPEVNETAQHSPTAERDDPLPASTTKPTLSPNDGGKVPDFHGFSIGSQMVSEVNQRRESLRKNSLRQSTDGQNDTPPEFVSFPAPNQGLQTPPSGLDGQEQEIDNMFHLGIDARMGTSISVLKLPQVPPSPQITQKILSQENSMPVDEPLVSDVPNVEKAKPSLVHKLSRKISSVFRPSAPSPLRKPPAEAITSGNVSKIVSEALVASRPPE
ncbi:hypothetical protein CSOJ01_10956 [Colletotrichum sojae]|uniref:Uncharacterized protein n=1 Tax=Colletotrichum sojae TaxID=2175907 RepID=A0A8H6IZ27_9PEZI|nr:hypothetical protein CSOJ01_10956 [Colletotrichum sojae]